MSNPIDQLRASDFVIFKGSKDGKPYEFAKVDSRCNLMNNTAFLDALKAEGTKTIEIAAK
jgi:hypothetical protein